nr:reverse transcriptase domain-containing protein [Tanacetum cinerariifolium]
MLPVTQIDTFYNGITLRHRDTINVAAGGTFMKRRLKEYYDLIKNMTAHHNDWDTSAQRSESSNSITSSFDPEIVALKAEMVEINKNLMKPSLAKLITYMLREPIIKVEDLKGITTRSGIAYKGPMIPTTSSPPKVVERKTEVTKDTVPPTNNGNTKDVQPLVVQIKTQVLISEPVAAPVVEPAKAPVSAPKPNPKPSIPYLSRLNDQKLCKKANDQMEKFFQIFQDLNFNISFADALILMPKFASTIRSLLTNKREILGDPGKFLIPCDFSGMDECLALADLDASINLMPLSVWSNLSLPELSPTCMTLELADRSISRSVGVVEDVSVKVGKFHFSADFVVVDFDADPRVTLILKRSFLKTERALIDVYEGELTLRVSNKVVTFNLDQTLRYSANYDAESINRIDVIDVACKEYSQEILGFSMSGNPTPSTEPIGDIRLLEEFLNDDPSSPLLPPQELKVVEPKNEKYSIDEPPMVKLKDLPPHLEYVFLEGDDKLPVIIAKDLKDEEKTTLIKVLKSHKQALAWKLCDIKGINPEFCTHKILMEDDFKPAVQHQRRVNPKIHEVIKKEYGVTFRLATAYHPQTSGQMEVSNHGLKRILERTVGKNHASWSYKLDDALWAFCTAFKTPIGCTSYKLVYEKACHLPIELEHKSYLALKHANLDLLTAADHQKVQLNELNELRDQAYENSLIYKEKTKRIHDSKIKDRVFNVGDRVLLFNSRLKILSGKLKTRWTGRFTTTQVFHYGIVELSQTDRLNFKVNGHSLKNYFGEDIPPMVVLDL